MDKNNAKGFAIALQEEKEKKKKKKEPAIGDAGDRTRGLSHAKRTRYHCATSPFHTPPTYTFHIFSISSLCTYIALSRLFRISKRRWALGYFVERMIPVNKVPTAILKVTMASL